MANFMSTLGDIEHEIEMETLAIDSQQQHMKDAETRFRGIYEKICGQKDVPPGATIPDMQSCEYKLDQFWQKLIVHKHTKPGFLRSRIMRLSSDFFGDLPSLYSEHPKLEREAAARFLAHMWMQKIIRAGRNILEIENGFKVLAIEVQNVRSMLWLILYELETQESKEAEGKSPMVE